MITLADRQQNRVFKPAFLNTSICACFFWFFLSFSTSAFAQMMLQSPQTVPSPLKAGHSAEPNKLSASTLVSKPLWQDLTPVQQISLAPLATNWNTLEEAQKRKWIAIAANYPALTQAEQTKLHHRMTEWVSLSYQQRAQARLNFAKSKQLTPTEKTASWEAYQALSPEEKQKMAALAPPKLTGAAIATKPVPPQKLTAIPVPRQALQQPLKTDIENHAVHRNTLLPQAKASADQASK
jgi:hypothetical protein